MRAEIIAIDKGGFVSTHSLTLAVPAALLARLADDLSDGRRGWAKTRDE